MDVRALVDTQTDRTPSSSSKQNMPPPTQRPRARQRAQLSCDRCRRLKRKCDQNDPCAECTSKGMTCSFERAVETSNALAKSREQRKAARRRSVWPENGSQRSHQHETLSSNASANISQAMHLSPMNHASSSTSSSSPGDGYSSHASSATTWTSPDGSVPSPAGKSHLATPSSNIEALALEPAFIERIMAVWYRELEWMSDAIRRSPFDRDTCKGFSSVASNPDLNKYKGLMFAIVAMCTLKNPTDVDAILISMASASERHGFYSAQAVGQSAHSMTAKWLDDHVKLVNVADWGSEAFQTAMVHGMYVKYTGNWNVYREYTSRDMDRLHRAGYHKLGDMVIDKGLSEDEIAARYNIFWKFFSVDRISSLFDGTPYTIQARNADTWLFTEDEAVHIRTLCRDSGAGAPLPEEYSGPPPFDERLIRKLQNAIPPYAVTMIKLGALAGRCSDRLNSMTQAPLSENYVRAEHIAAETDDELQMLESQIPIDLFTHFERPMVTMTIVRIRRDVTTRLSRHIARQHRAAPNGEEALVQTLNRRCLNTAKSLIRRVTSTAGGTPVHAISMPFFTLFVAETMVELLTSIEEIIQDAEKPVELDSEAKDDLRHALIARNFLSVLARKSEMALNKMIAYKACMHVQTVLQTCVPRKDAHVYHYICDIERITDPDSIVDAIPSPRQAMGGSEGSPQRAEDVLNFLGSLTSLQRIFEMGGETWSD